MEPEEPLREREGPSVELGPAVVLVADTPAEAEHTALGAAAAGEDNTPEEPESGGHSLEDKRPEVVRIAVAGGHTPAGGEALGETAADHKEQGEPAVDMGQVLAGDIPAGERERNLAAGLQPEAGEEPCGFHGKAEEDCQPD